jgi:hypothetical protein
LGLEIEQEDWNAWRSFTILKKMVNNQKSFKMGSKMIFQIQKTQSKALDLV